MAGRLYQRHRSCNHKESPGSHRSALQRLPSDGLVRRAGLKKPKSAHIYTFIYTKLDVLASMKNLKSYQFNYEFRQDKQDFFVFSDILLSCKSSLKIFAPAEPYREESPPNQAATLSSLQRARFGLLMEISACALPR